MSISRKPKPQEKHPAIDVEALIQKGGSVAQSTPAPKENAPLVVLLRIPSPIAQKLDEALTSREIHTPRTTWILEAIIEKLERETQN